MIKEKIKLLEIHMYESVALKDLQNKPNYIIPLRSFLCGVASLKSTLKRKHDSKYSHLIIIF